MSNITRPAPTAANQTNEAWYVHVEGRSVFPAFNYAKRAPSEAMFEALINSATPFRSDALEITGLGYEDITIVVQEEWLAQALVSCLNRILPQASQSWREDCMLGEDSVYAMKLTETSEEMDGKFFWVAGEPTGEQNIHPEHGGAPHTA